MTITVEYAGNKARWGKNLTFYADKSDIRTATFDYTGEIGSDTVSSATATTSNITAATPSVSNNTVSTSLSGGSEGTTAKVDLTMTTTAGDVISTTVYFKITDR